MSAALKKTQDRPDRPTGESLQKTPFLDRRGTQVVWAMMALYAAVYITLCVVKYVSFLYSDFDMAIDAQAAYLIPRGSSHSSILNMNYFGNHLRLLILPIVPIYAMLPSPVTLLVLQTVVLALGAGVYEEFLFRMVLIGALAAGVRAVTQRSWTISFVAGTLIAAVLFALAHQRGPLGEEFRLTMFLFRMFAALYFGMVYYLRGLGIAAGAHVVYHVSYWLFLFDGGGA